MVKLGFSHGRHFNSQPDLVMRPCIYGHHTMSRRILKAMLFNFHHCCFFVSENPKLNSLAKSSETTKNGYYMHHRPSLPYFLTVMPSLLLLFLSCYSILPTSSVQKSRELILPSTECLWFTLYWGEWDRTANLIKSCWSHTRVLRTWECQTL